MTKNKNFSKGTTPRIIDTEYVFCNFMQPQPTLVDGKWQGTRIFPGDDTPRTFRSCNLVNCEVPPGSTVIDCNTAIVQRDAAATVRGEQKPVCVVHGRYLDPNTIEYKDTVDIIDKETGVVLDNKDVVLPDDVVEVP